MNCPPRYATPKTGRPNLGAQIGKVAAALGFPLMPHQQLIADVATELNELRRLVYKQIAITMPRQSGKSNLVLPVMVHAALSKPGTKIVYTAQTRLDARKRLCDEWAPTLAASPFASLVRARKGAGAEALMFANGSRISLVSGTRTGGHGESLDLAVVDESWAQTSDVLEASLRPTMVTRPEPQFWIISTAGDETSMWLRQKVDAGRTSCELGITETSAYFEWSAPEGTDLGDPETWESFMPALAAGLVTREAIAADRALMPPSEFARAYANWWPEMSFTGWRVIPQDVWEAAADDGEAG